MRFHAELNCSTDLLCSGLHNMLTEVIALLTGIGIIGGLYFKVRQIRREAYPKRREIFQCTREFLGRAWADPNADGVELL